jgi:tetratricopeptide (TPR) repeat protein
LIETVDCTPDHALRIAIRLQAEGKLKEAEDIFRGILEIDPNHFHALNRLGALLTEKKEYYEALYRFDRAIKVDPKAAMAISNRGMILGELGHAEESEAEFRKAIEFEPYNHLFWNNLSVTLERLMKYDEALVAVDKGLSLLEPPETSATMLLDKGVILQRLNRYSQAIACHTQALEINPEKPESHYNLAICKLTTGDLLGGFKEYEWRSKVEEEKGNMTFAVKSGKPCWTGEDISDKAIIIHAEQGLGDTIQFLRYLPLVIQRARTVYLIVHAPLMSLASERFGHQVTILKTSDTYPPHDYICSLMSLPFVFKTTNGTIPKPWQIPLDRDIVNKRSLDINRHPGLKVGICWSGNCKQKNDFRRSIKFKDFSDLLDIEGVTFFSLQKEVRQEDEHDVAACKKIHHLDLGDFKDTSAIVSLLDLVVTVDTSVGHLAGTIGVPTWILVPALGFNCFWQQNRKDSPWYGSVRLFRQDKRAEWSPVIQKIKASMSDLAGRKKAA